MDFKKLGAALQTDPPATADEIKEFRPFAYYDRHLDCIRVHLRDCSVLEERKNRIFTVMKANHSNGNVVQGDFVGFNIKGVRHLFKKFGFGLDKQACYSVAYLLSEILKHYPDQYGQDVADKVQPVLEKFGLEVQMDFAAA